MNNNFEPSDEYIKWFYEKGRPFTFPSSGVNRRTRQHISANVHKANALRMSYSHPKLEHDPRLSSNHWHSFSHAMDDDEARCYRPEPPTSRLHTDLLMQTLSPAYLFSVVVVRVP